MKCKECGTKIENNASFCPNCGASINKDNLKIFQKGWFWLLIAILIVVILAIIINNAFFGNMRSRNVNNDIRFCILKIIYTKNELNISMPYK